MSVIIRNFRAEDGTAVMLGMKVGKFYIYSANFSDLDAKTINFSTKPDFLYGKIFADKLYWENVKYSLRFGPEQKLKSFGCEPKYRTANTVSLTKGFIFFSADRKDRFDLELSYENGIFSLPNHGPIDCANIIILFNPVYQTADSSDLVFEQITLAELMTEYKNNFSVV